MTKALLLVSPVALSKLLLLQQIFILLLELPQPVLPITCIRSLGLFGAIAFRPGSVHDSKTTTVVEMIASVYIFIYTQPYSDTPLLPSERIVERSIPSIIISIIPRVLVAFTATWVRDLLGSVMQFLV